MSCAWNASLFDKCKQVRFIKANPVTVAQTSVTVTNSSPTVCGDEVRSFYETLLSEPSTSAVSHNSSQAQLEKVKNSRRRRRKSTKLSNCVVKKQDYIRENFEEFFKDAANGDVQGVTGYCKRGIDINVSDQYGWTALMCASYAGHSHIVEYLLSIGVDISKRSKSGETAADFALKCGHGEIYRRISLHEKEGSYMQCEPSLQKVRRSRNNKEITRFCATCQLTYVGKAHLSSLVHLLETRKPVLHPGYQIPEWNKGYRILRKSGWDEFEGLGRHATGRRYPIKTKLKRDKLGLGCATSDKPKAEDVNTVKVRPTTIKKDTRKRVLHDKILEMQFRNMFRDD